MGTKSELTTMRQKYRPKTVQGRFNRFGSRVKLVTRQTKADQ